MANYPSDPLGPRRPRRAAEPGSANPYLPPIEQKRGHSGSVPPSD